MVRSRYSRYCASGRYDTTLYPTPEALYDELERRCSVDLRVPLQAAATSDGWVDMLAVGARARSRREWRACLEIPGLEILTASAPPRWDTECVQKLVRRRVAGKQPLPPSLFDAYRVLSGGLMHSEDLRPWRMKRAAMRRLRRQQQWADTYIEALHSRYSHLLFLERYSEAHALTPALLGCIAVAGGMADVMHRQLSTCCTCCRCGHSRCPATCA